MAVENPCQLGCPDVNYTGGWIELKKLDRWPVRPATPATIRHFTAEQRAWLRQRAVRGGATWLLLKVGRSEWLLFDGRTAARHVGLCDKEGTISRAVHYWPRGLVASELIAALKGTECQLSRIPPKPSNSSDAGTLAGRGS